MKKHIKFYLKTSSNLNAFLLSHTIFIKHSALENVFLRIFSNFCASPRSSFRFHAIWVLIVKAIIELLYFELDFRSSFPVYLCGCA